MIYRNLGRNGLKVSAFSLGSWLTFGKTISNQIASELMHTAYDNGINFFDSAEIYARGAAETVMGNIIANADWDRSSFAVSSKVFWGGDKPMQNGLSKKHVFDACHAALQRFKLDYLDLFFCHRPDPETPIEETVWAMHQLVMQGKIMYWGTSEWTGKDIIKAIEFANENHLVAPCIEQPQYSLISKERFEEEYKEVFEKYQIGTTIWSPLATGLLTGKYNDGNPDEKTRLNSIDGLEWLSEKVLTTENIDKARIFSQFCEKELSTKPALVALAWCLKNPNVSTVILGASKVEQLKENLKALDVIEKITPEIKVKIEEIFK